MLLTLHDVENDLVIVEPPSFEKLEDSRSQNSRPGAPCFVIKKTAKRGLSFLYSLARGCLPCRRR